MFTTNGQTDGRTHMFKSVQNLMPIKNIFLICGVSEASLWALQTFWQNKYTPHFAAMHFKCPEELPLVPKPIIILVIQKKFDTILPHHTTLSPKLKLVFRTYCSANCNVKTTFLSDIRLISLIN